MTAATFTAAEIATGLGRRRESVARTLAAIPATGTKVVGGNEARAWAVSSLPTALLGELERLAVKQGCKDVETLLRQSGEPWSPPIPLAHCDEKSVNEARRLRDALRPTLQREAQGMRGAELERLGVADFHKFAGYPITARHFRDLLARTLRRAGAVHDLEKLELYLPERPKARVVEIPKAAATDDEATAVLRSYVEAFGVPGQPTLREREALWTTALEVFDTLMAGGATEAQAGRQVRAAILRLLPGFTTVQTMQKTFARKLAAWRASGRDPKAVRDGRRENTGNFDNYELPESDLNVLVNLAVWQFPGHVAAAWRHAHKHNLLTPATASRYPLSGANKSQVPGKIREAVTPEVRIFRQMKLHQKAASDLVPHLTRSYDGIYSGDVFNADDVTWPVYSYVTNPDGTFSLVRGQCLLFIDVKSLKVVGWSFQPDANYSSLVIRTLCTKIFSELCVPKLAAFESGLWKTSKLLVGKNPDGSLPGVEVVQGLREFGIKIVNSHIPRAKLVERVIGLLQDLMEGEPGFCGRDERHDLPAHTKRAMDDVKFNRCHPSKHFYSFDQWHKRLGALIDQYNATAQEGRLEGLSPDEAFDRFMNNDDPPTVLPPELHYLLAHHREEREVKASGLQFRVGRNVFRYFGESLAPFVGRRVLAWFNPEMPDSLVVTGLDRKNPVVVPRASAVPAYAGLIGEEETLAAGMAQAEGQMAHLRARYNVVKGAVPLPHRRVVADPAALRTGQQIAELQRKKEAGNRVEERVAQRARKIGLVVPPQARRSEQVEGHVKYLQEYLNDES